MSSDLPFHRKSLRLKGYDYSQAGCYFVTMCVHSSLKCPVGAGSKPAHLCHIENHHVVLNEYGKIVWETWVDLPKHVSNIDLDEFVIMPDHIHGIVVIRDFCRDVNIKKTGFGFERAGLGLTGAGLEPERAGLEPAPTRRYSLSEIVRQFKTFSSRRINELRNARGKPVWQRNFYEHVIRNEKALDQIRAYIMANPFEKQEATTRY